MGRESEESARSFARRVAPVVVYLVLFAGAIPWYWPEDDDSIWLGAPAWAVIAIIGSVLLSVYTAIRLARPWEGEVPRPGERERSPEWTRDG